MQIADKYRDLFDHEEEYIHISSVEEASTLFDIFYNTYGVSPGPVMRREFLHYNYAYNSGHTIEGYCSKRQHYLEFSEFVSRYCETPIKMDFDSISPLL